MDGCQRCPPDNAKPAAAATTTAAAYSSVAVQGGCAEDDITAAAAVAKAKDDELKAYCAAIKAQFHDLLAKFCNELRLELCVLCACVCVCVLGYFMQKTYDDSINATS